MTQNVLYAVHYVSTNHLSSLHVILWTTPWTSFWWWNMLRLIHPLPLLLTCSRPVSSPMCLSERYHSFLPLPSRLYSVKFLLVTFCGIIFLLVTSFPCHNSVGFPPSLSSFVPRVLFSPLSHWCLLPEPMSRSLPPPLRVLLLPRLSHWTTLPQLLPLFFIHLLCHPSLSFFVRWWLLFL